VEGNTLSRGFNILGTGCPTTDSDQAINAAAVLNELLGPLAGNGGPTLTHALVAGSIGDNAADTVSCLDVDQRGTSRQQNGKGCDIGAFERVNAASNGNSNSGGGGSSGGAGGWLFILAAALATGRAIASRRPTAIR
jgi:uncharacterized membrane protein YgcG